MFWWFERGGRHLRCEVLQLSGENYELRVIDPDGNERVERFVNCTALAKRQQAVQNGLAATGWTGPHGWVL